MSSSSTTHPVQNEKAAPPGDARLIAAVTAAWMVSLFGYYAQSQLLGHVMSEFGKGEAAVGWLFSVENAALALSILAAAGPLARFSRARAAALGATVVLLASVASAFAPSWEFLLVMRCISGMGAGLAGAAGTAAAASARDPERVYAAVIVAWGLAGAAEPTVIPYFTAPFGTMGGFLLIAAVALLVMPLFTGLLSPRETPGEEPSLFAAPHRTLALVAMAGLFIFEIGQGGVWMFIAQIGENTGLTEYRVGNVITGAELTGLSGGIVATWLGGRFGRKWPIVLGLGFNVIAAVGMALTTSSLSYVIFIVLWNTAYNFVVPYLMGAMAAMDDLGRWVVASDGAWTLGDAAGPAVAGNLVEWGGHAPLALLALVGGLSCMLMVLGVMHRFEAGERLPGEEPPPPPPPSQQPIH
ncbi:MAG: MFS transporter [Deltaproteobacteria bacterium]|nr:MFS transporter [Deltaproteobacteria bacterium]